MKTGYVISDLHLFTNRSSAIERMPEILHLADNADLLVLNGDIVDFRWSTFPSIGSTIDALFEWREKLYQHSPECRVYYIMGNHDANEQLADALEGLHRRNGKFGWSPSHLQFEDVLFFHGDCIAKGEVIDKRYLPLSQRILSAPALHFLYQLSVSLRLHRLLTVTDTPVRNVKKIDYLIDRTFTSQQRSDIKRVYFGHSHIAFSGLKFNGRRYFNTGSLIRHVRFLPQKFLFHNLPF